MKYGVSRNILLLLAGIVWIVAGSNILRIAIINWTTEEHYGAWGIIGAIAIFLTFFLFIFRRLYKKHIFRISKKENKKNCPFSFFDRKGWLVMLFMICLGVFIRKFDVLPPGFISMFYTGLSTALIATGMLFIRYWWHNKTEEEVD